MAAKRTQKGAKSANKAKKSAPAKKAAPAKAAKKPTKPAAKKVEAPKKPAPKAGKGKAPAPKGKPAASKASESKATPTSGKPGPKGAPAVAKGAPAKGAPAKSAPAKGAPAPRPAILPPKSQASSRGIEIPKSKGRPDQITLVPARSSSPGARPSQAGRPGAAGRGSAPPSKRPQGVTLVRRTSDRPSGGLVHQALPIPVRKVEQPPTLEERFSRLEKRLNDPNKTPQEEAFQKAFWLMFDQAWVSHDSALEGTVYTREEIEAGFSAEPMLTDSSLQPAADEIRRHREAIEFVRDFGLKKKLPVNLDVIKKIYLILHPSEGDLKTVKYRKDVPQHRLYFHEYAAPDKIAFKVRQVVDWLNDPERKKSGSAIRVAARVHYDLLRVFPFQTDSGKVARLFLNLLLYRSGYPPAIIHAKERQGYYEALKGEPNKILRIVQDAVEDGLASIEKLFAEQESKKRPFVN